MSRKFIFAREAGADALAIWEFIAENDSEAAADRVIARIYDECDKLAESPAKGHFREELLDRRHRFWNVWSYLIAYRWEARPIQVIAVVHGARDLNVLLRGKRK
jgi:antitoxin ParD1/3/4/toxin ParE1/3/4